MRTDGLRMRTDGLRMRADGLRMRTDGLRMQRSIVARYPVWLLMKWASEMLPFMHACI